MWNRFSTVAELPSLVVAREYLKENEEGVLCLGVAREGKNPKCFQVEGEDTVKNRMDTTHLVSGHQMLPGCFGNYWTSSLMTSNLCGGGYS